MYIVKNKALCVLLLSCVTLVICLEDNVKNESNVMKLNSAFNRNHPKMLLSKYNNERKEKEDHSVHIPVATKLEEIRNITESNYPMNLEIVGKILSKLKNEICVKDTTTVLDAMSRQEKWTLQMFDSFPKFPVGLLYGNYFMLGNFDECIDVKQPDMPDNPIQGQYCLADIHLNEEEQYSSSRIARSFMEKKIQNRHLYNHTYIHWGICIPSSCTSEDAAVFVQEIFTFTTDDAEKVSVTVDKNRCHFKHTTPFSDLEIIYGSIIGLVVILTLLATASHYWYMRQRARCIAYTIESVRPRESTMKELIFCFSIIRNVEKFLHTKPSDLNLECICGVKLLSMFMIVSGHALIFLIGGPVINANYFPQVSTQVENGMFLNNPLLVDTFLLVSGFLMCRLLLIEFDKRKGSINFLILYIARYIRLTPSYLVILGLYCTILYRLGNGPLWDLKIGTERERCLESWWTNLLYINNYVNTDHLCMFQSWYLAVDYHLFIVAPFVIYPLWKWSKIGETTLAICTSVSVAVPFYITYKDKLDPTLLAFPPEISDLSTNYYFVNSYIKTHMRASSYCLGILFGYLVHKIQSSGKKIYTCVIWFGWTISIVFGTLSMFSIVIFYSPNHEANPAESAIYASLHRVAWCISVGWCLIACITDNARLVNKFLSWKPFIPLSRLTYCAYLTNGLVEIYCLGTIRQPFYLSTFDLTITTLGHLVLTFVSAFLLCILFESPIHGVERILLRKDKRHRDQHTNKTSTVTPMEET